MTTFKRTSSKLLHAVFLLALAFAPRPLSAQDVPSVTIRLLAFSRVGTEMEVSLVGPDAKLLDKDPLALPTQQLSPFRKVKARVITFIAPRAPEKPGTPPVPDKILGKVTLPATGNEFVLVFLPAAAGSAIPYQVDAVALPVGEFGSGDYAFINYSGQPVGCVIDEEKLPVAHGKSAIYHPMKSGKGAGNRSIVCYTKKDSKWDPVPFFSSRLIIQEGVRNIVLICLDPRTGRTDFRGIPDFIGK